MKNHPEFMNAKQIYETFGVPRSMLGRLVDAGKLNVNRIEDGFACLNLYRVADVERFLSNGGGADVGC